MLLLPFDSLATSSKRFLSFKALFLVPITSTHRASELAALCVDPPFLQFHPDKVTLYPDISFLPKVTSDFHIRQPIILPTFFPSPSIGVERSLHLLHVRCALAFYVINLSGYLYRLIHLTEGQSYPCRLSHNGCCGFFGLFGRVMKVVLPNISPVSVAGIFRGQHSEAVSYTHLTLPTKA